MKKLTVWARVKWNRFVVSIQKRIIRSISPLRTNPIPNREIICDKQSVRSRGVDEDTHFIEVSRVMISLLYKGNSIYEVNSVHNEAMNERTTIIYYLNKYVLA
jgi:hypothetical protein